jgi:hypothetical protein
MNICRVCSERRLFVRKHSTPTVPQKLKLRPHSLAVVTRQMTSSIAERAESGVPR